jgi:hypothetical protein
MTGEESGLSAATIAELAQWDAMFDYETHGLVYPQRTQWTG